MNREDIIRMAREVGGADISINGWTSWVGTQSTEFLERFAALVAKHTLANIDPSSFMTWQEGYEVGKQTAREWVGLTEDEAFACQGRDYFETYKAIEAKLKEKNT